MGEFTVANFQTPGGAASPSAGPRDISEAYGGRAEGPRQWTRKATPSHPKAIY
jgi:hypothetical protein